MLLLHLLACTPLTLDAPVPYARVVYDTSGDLPLPNDLLRDEGAGHLDLPIEVDDLPAEVALRTFLNGLDGWSSTASPTASFSEAVELASVTEESVQVWEWGATPARVPGARVELAEDALSVVIQPPRRGWSPGGRYAVVVLGGEAGVRTTSGLELGPDAVMTWLRGEDALDDPAHQRAFPGESRAARADVGARLERTRAALDPWFAAMGVAREDTAALWSFTVTDRVELAMDRESQRIPLPFDLLLNPETGRVDLTPVAWDSPLEAEAKLVANTFTGFGLSSNPFFELTLGIDPATATPDTVQLWDVSRSPQRVPADVVVMNEAGREGCRRPPFAPDCKHVFVQLPPDQIPLTAATTYAVVVTDGLRDLQGRAVVAMPLGHLVMTDAALTVDGRTQVGNLDDAEAARVETVRRRVDALLDQLGREHVVAAWPFTTMDPLPAIEASAHRSERLGIPIEPEVEWRRPASSVLVEDAIGELFPGALNPAPAFYLGRVDGVREVISGTLRAPDWLDDVTRRTKAEYDLEKLPFWAITPAGYSAERRLPVVIFGHAIVTDRRFLLMIASELAQRGFVVIGIDFPFHGRRVACVEASLVAVPNFFPEGLRSIIGFEDDLIWFPPCESGDAASCAPTGECLDAAGRTEPFSTFPIIDLKPASGAAFMDTADIPHIPDHFHQALADLSSLAHSLRTADWETALGQRLDTERLYFAGQSLGSIIGSVWVAPRTDVERAVFNVPGSNLVDLFIQSTYFKPQMDQLFVDLEIPDGSYEHERLLQVASWLIDSVDPHSVAHLYADRAFPGLIQMDKVDEDSGDLIIPNFTTENLARVSGLPVIAYPSILHADLIVPLLGDAMLDDMGEHLGGVPR